MKYKVDWGIVLPVVSFIYLVIYGLLNAHKIGECFLTYYYCVWQCDVTFGLILYVISILVLGIFCIYELFSLCFIMDGLEEK